MDQNSLHSFEPFALFNTKSRAVITLHSLPFSVVDTVIMSLAVSIYNNKVLLCWFIVAYQNVKNKLRQIEELYFPLGDVEIFLKLFHKLGMPIIPLASQ